MQSQGNGTKKRRMHVPVPGHPGIYASDRAGGKHVYEIRFTDSSGRRQYKVCGPKITDAKREQVAVEHKKNTVGFVSSTATLADVWEDWLKVRDIRKGSIRTFDFQWTKHIEPALGNRKVRDLDDRAILVFLRGLTRKDGKPGDLADSTKRLIHATLEILLTHAAVSMKVIPAVPKLPKKLRPKQPKAGSTRGRILTHDEERTLLAYCAPFPFLGPVVQVALHQALRLGEVSGLQWEDVDFAAGKMHIRRSLDRDRELGPTKSGNERTIPLTPRAREVLLDLRLDSDGAGPVFRNTFGEQRHIRDIQRRFTTAVKRAGLDGFTFHGLRHTGISRLANHPAIPLVQVRDFAGHANLSTTEGYVHRIEDEKVTVSIGEALTGVAA
jgi:integrase